MQRREEMIVCESTFKESPADKNDPSIALHELDIYATVKQPRPGHCDHRLSMRYRWASGEFEVYRRYRDDDKDSVVFAGCFHEALETANLEYVRQWGERQDDTECTHEVGPGRAHGCRVKVDG